MYDSGHFSLPNLVARHSFCRRYFLSNMWEQQNFTVIVSGPLTKPASMQFGYPEPYQSV